jgi:hypothetical protein
MEMRLLGHTSVASQGTSPQVSMDWLRSQRACKPSVTEPRVIALKEAEIERLARTNRELRDVLAQLIAFAGPRTAIVNECGDRILDPRVLNAKAALVALDAGL